MSADIDVAALRAAAEAATCGSWWADSGWSVSAPAPEDWQGPYVVAETQRIRNDAAFIAAANPQVVLTLLDRLTEVEDMLERTEQQIHERDGFIDQTVDQEERIGEMQAELDRLRACQMCDRSGEGSGCE